MNINKRVLSLGAGTQSTDLLLRSLRGEMEHKPDYAIFADVGNEPKGVYKHLEWLINHVDKEYGFQIKVISAGNIYQDAIEFISGNINRADGMPLHIKSDDGSQAILNRQCTGYYKILPIRRFVKKHKQPGRFNKVELWLGISYEESQRMKDPDVKWLIHRYPLVEKKIRRADCIKNFKAHNIPVPYRSSCIICPYHSNDYWYWLYVTEPDSFESAVFLDDMIRDYPGIENAQCYLHRSCRPLKEVIIDLARQKELQKRQLSIFPELIDECDGVCGS
ncbi:hypothetical protein QQ008_07435 [Fulvivirgaceae bacterium BMA10]|uniref:Phosphoadenosine phosphosulphate reductase domain-containing protein n=1 Tax=Splendidivirga corallicola TaxID=3051826 RepID=A0ABT8KKF3_9BACT|nr:hypothetical protein [Fulvivirgaceae bacterium BMA10]